MRDKDDIASSSCPLSKEVENDISQFAVQGARGFIQDEDWPLDLERPQQGKPLLLAAAQVVPPFVKYKFERLFAEAIVQLELLNQ